MQPNQAPEIIRQKQKDGKLKLEVRLPPEGEFEAVCEMVDSQGELIAIKSVSVRAADYQRSPKKRTIWWWVDWGKAGFAFALLVYLLIRLIGLEDFPIYFFSDEAIQSVQAADLIRDHFYSPYHELLLVYFENGGQYNLSTSVYYQVLPVLLFGKSILVTRTSAALLALLSALAVAAMVVQGTGKKTGWLAVLVLSLMPAWFLHSRTAFETAMAVNFYAGFVACYGFYRLKDVRFLYPAALFAALAFYSYSPMQMVVGVTLVGLLISDGRYHWQQRKTFFKALGLGLILMLPYLRFSLDHPGEGIRHLEILGSYWTQNLPWQQKITRYLQIYGQGLNPLYWFLPDQVDLQRHLMKGYGHLWQVGFPFLWVGLYWCIRHFKQSFARLLLITLLAAPSGASLVEIGITRLLVMVIPATLLVTAGMLQIWDWLKYLLKKSGMRRSSYELLLKVGVFILLAALNVGMLVDALHNGATWYSNYGLYGMQYGARQVFAAIRDELQNNPDQKIVLTSAWANGADVLARFFFPDPLPFQMGSIEGYIKEYKPLDPQTLFVMTPEEMKNVQSSQKITDIRTLKIIPYPNGEPGFYFSKVEYAPDIEKIFTEEQAARRKMQSASLTLPDGQAIDVEFSTLDMGEIKHVFDGDRNTLARTWESNPFRIVVHFAQPRRIDQLIVKVGGEGTRITAELWEPGSLEPLILEKELPAASEPRFTELKLAQPKEIAWAEIRITNLNNNEPAHVHLWEVQFQP